MSWLSKSKLVYKKENLSEIHVFKQIYTNCKYLNEKIDLIELYSTSGACMSVSKIKIKIV